MPSINRLTSSTHADLGFLDNKEDTYKGSCEYSLDQSLIEQNLNMKSKNLLTNS